jgi:hypothetical protein
LLVPLTDSSNPYSAMMLELIANDRRFPASKYPPERNVAAFRLALIAAALVGIAAFAAVVAGLI